MKIALSALKQGDKVGVWTASDPIIGTEAVQWINRGKKKLEEMGFPVVLGGTLSTKTGYTAGTPEYRYKEFLHFIKNPEIKMIITALGGENAHHILPLMDFELIGCHPKIIMGYSDPTVFLNPISTFSKIPTFYGPHLSSFDPEWPWFGDYDKKCFERIFINAESPFEVPPAGPRESWGRRGISEGRLVGGSLTDLTKLLSTPWEPDWDNAMLILETMNQSFQKIDVHITHLLQAGVFDRISGLILGKFYNCIPPSEGEQSLKALITRLLSNFKLTVLKTVDFGHFSHICPLPLGAKCRINTKTKCIYIQEQVINQS